MVWDSHGLFMVPPTPAWTQILKDGFAQDRRQGGRHEPGQRIFGTYGPGPARDVLSQLLDGTNYDVLMVGDQGQGTPRQVVLTRPRGAARRARATPTPPAPSDEDNAEPRKFRSSRSLRSHQHRRRSKHGNAAPVPVRTQQQMIEEMQERQRQLQQMQQQQQNPQN